MTDIDPVLVRDYRERFWSEARRTFANHLEHERRRGLDLTEEEEEALEDAFDATWSERMKAHCAYRDSEYALLKAARGETPADLAALYEEHGDG